MGSTGSHQRQLTHLKSIQYFGDLDWAPTGRSLVIDAFPSTRAAGPTSGSSARDGQDDAADQHAAERGGRRCGRPNGSWIAFFSQGRAVSLNWIWRLSVATKRLVQLTSGNPAALYPAWSPDSRRSALHPRRSGRPDERRRQPQDRAAPVRSSHSWSPDWQWLVYVENGDLFKVRTNGTCWVQLTHHGKQVVNDQPDW